MTEVPPVERRMKPEYGVTLDGVWFPLELLGRLMEQRRYDSEFGAAFIDASADQERVLIARNLAVKETRGGLHSSGTGLRALVRGLYAWVDEHGWPGKEET